MALPNGFSIPNGNSQGANNPLLDDEEEIAFTAESRSALKEYKTTDDPILEAIENNYRDLKKKYPNGGWKSFQFITADILRQAPKNWFEQFDKDLQAATNWTQGQLATRDRSESIAEAQADPTNDALQDEAFRAIYSILAEYLDSVSYRGIQRWIMVSLVSSEIIGLSKIDPLWRDRSVDEIIINGPRDVQIEVSGQLYRVPAANFRDADHVLGMLERVFGSINKQLSKTDPLMKGRLHDQSRIFAVHPVVAPDGPNVAIRRHPEGYWTPESLANYGSIDPEVGKFLGNLIHSGCSFAVIGGTSTGKTSFLNAMTGFYPDNVRVITLEDNLEMKPNPTKMLAAAMETKPGNIERGDNGITMRDLVKGSLQMRPDALIIGEVTDGAAADLVQALNTGHFGASTIHANSEFDGIYRIASLVQLGGRLAQAQTLPLIAAAFDFIVFLEHFPLDGSRRVVSISEIDPYVTAESGKEPTLGVKQLFKFVNDGVVNEPDSEGAMKPRIIGHWEKTGDLSDVRRQRRHLDLHQELSWDELVELSTIPDEYLPEVEEEA